MSYVQLGTHQVPGSSNTNNTSAGSPGASGDGITWPYNPNGQTPDFQINWNSVPPPTAAQVEATYEALINWLKNNTGSPAFYNGSILLLQMTVDIGQHMGDYSSSDQAQLSQFLSNQINTPGNQTFLQLVLEICSQAVAVESPNGRNAYNNVVNFLTQVENAMGPLTQYGSVFSSILSQAQDELNDNSSDSIGTWIVNHWNSSLQTWVDDETADPNNGIYGPQPMDFADFTLDAQWALGTALTPSSGDTSSVDGAINAMFQTEIEQLVEQFKGNPWALLVALMNLINQRDQNNGGAVNGYGGTLDQIKNANNIIQKMLGDISGTTPNMADFYAQLQQLKQLVMNDPSLAGVVSQLQADVGTINGQTVDVNSVSDHWTVQSGYYNFPPGTQISINGHIMTVPASGVIHITSDNSLVAIISPPPGVTTFTFGQLAAMGDTQDIQTQMGNWAQQVMSNFENGVTGMQTLLNSPSAGIQQQIQNMTQTMQAEENFEKQAYASITDVNSQVMKLVQSVMG